MRIDIATLFPEMCETVLSEVSLDVPDAQENWRFTATISAIIPRINTAEWMILPMAAVREC